MNAENDTQTDGMERSPFDAKPLNADEYKILLEEYPAMVLRVSDGTGDGTFRFWSEDGTFYFQSLNWTTRSEATLNDLKAVLDGDTTTQLLIECSLEPDTERAGTNDE